MNIYTSYGCSSRSSRQMVKPFRTYIQNTIIQRYINNGGEGSRIGPISGHVHYENLEGAPRAPSTAEEFERVAEEKAKQGLESQTAGKAEDAIEEATIGESSYFETTKEIYKEPAGEGNSDKKEDV